MMKIDRYISVLLHSLLGALFFVSCQSELYDDPYEKPTGLSSEQAIYLHGSGEVSQFLESGGNLISNEIKVRRVRSTDQESFFTVVAGTQADLDAYNAANKTSYQLMPAEMYELPNKVTFPPLYTETTIPVKLNNVVFSPKGSYALPIVIQSTGDADVIKGEDKVFFIVEELIKTKCLRISGNGTEDGSMFPDNFKVDQWTLEVMVNRNNYRSNNRSIVGTKLVSGSSMNDEIYTRFGDVTIKTNQLQIKTANSQIDIPEDKFAAKPGEWYMITFVYDGQRNSVYVNGMLVASNEMRTGPYGLVGFWIGGTNELIREVRFWKIARTQAQIADNAWKMVNPADENLLLYYPANGKKRNKETGEITVDETMVWDWSQSEKHLKMPSGARFDDNGGNMFIFPLQD